MANMTITAMAKHYNCQLEMNDPRLKAIDVAIAVYRQPNQFVIPKPGHFPDKMLDVIKSAAGDEDTITSLSLHLDMPSDTVSQVCKFYLQKLLTAGGNDPFRMLALDRDATAAEVKEHKRWLLKWLHPDRNPSKWESALFLMIGKAAQQLENGYVSEELRPAASRHKKKQQSRRVPWTYTKVHKRKSSIIRSLKPIILALSAGLIFVFVLTSAISNWTLIQQVIR
jgi:hypothetical protein